MAGVCEVKIFVQHSFSVYCVSLSIYLHVNQYRYPGGKVARG
jgi:hypothetical protein